MGLLNFTSPLYYFSGVRSEVISPHHPGKLPGGLDLGPTWKRQPQPLCLEPDIDRHQLHAQKMDQSGWCTKFPHIETAFHRSHPKRVDSWRSRFGISRGERRFTDFTAWVLRVFNGRFCLVHKEWPNKIKRLDLWLFFWWCFYGFYHGKSSLWSFSLLLSFVCLLLYCWSGNGWRLSFRIPTLCCNRTWNPWI